MGNGENEAKNGVTAALEDELTTKKLVCLFSSANSGHAQASVCNIVATVHPEAAGALRQECMALVTRCTGLSDNKEKQVQVREVPQERREKPAKHATKDSGKSKRTSGKKSSDAKSNFYEDYIVSIGIVWQLKDLLTHSNTQKAVLGCKSLESAFHALKMIETQIVVEQAVLISNSGSFDSLECLFGDEKDVSSRSIVVPITNPLKEDHDDESCDVTDDKKASLKNRIRVKMIIELHSRVFGITYLTVSRLIKMLPKRKARSKGLHKAREKNVQNEHIKANLKEVTASNGKIVVFVDEIHTVVSASRFAVKEYMGV
ncbi:Armadillo-like helical [Artemisia annua]|uniref:Armadillo-like helical n=1 Tax=Artemisia annua TaxID=35608 RepID=A0A2U1NCM6_ARTAN|nr:Armadillo-like helical [Artemisia annua]